MHEESKDIGRPKALDSDDEKIIVDRGLYQNHSEETVMARLLLKDYKFSTDIGDIVPFKVQYYEDERKGNFGSLKVFKGNSLIAEKLGKLELFEEEPLDFVFQDEL